MMTTTQLAEALGRKRMAQALGVGLTAVSNAVVSGQFPAAWFDTLEAMAQERGVECPRHLFGFRRAFGGDAA